MADKSCAQCDQAAQRVTSQYPIWSVHCEACNKRALSWYPEHSLAGMNMALLVGMKRGFPYVNRLLRELREAGVFGEVAA
jgi:hypothetical protein